MIVAVASGKGGTGKTTVATNLARVCAEAGRATQYLDCDVEEPNGHIFLKPQIERQADVTVEVPEIDATKCTACGQCGQICQYSAIVCLQDQVLTFESLCHSCGGCWRVCPSGAIERKPLRIGQIETGRAETLGFVGGRLEIGHVRTPALIGRVKKHIEPDALAIVDVPPGTSCPVVAALKGVDVVVLVTEPTPFGLNDLKLAVELVREMGLPFGVVLNRDGIGDDETQSYCAAEQIDILARLPDDRRIAQAYSSGQMIVDAMPEYEDHFRRLAAAIGCLE
ncbi:MAG: ATP-binding protein [Sedimentisphaerales bacterium]|nr:ATP-binding protein [Sedimentisphaerales bacterium]